MNFQKVQFPICFRSLFVLSFLLGDMWPVTGHSQPANEPLEKFVVTDGVVCALAHTNHVIYFGGSFGLVGVRTGGGVPVSANTGQAESVFPSVNGEVEAAIADEQGGWFVGGGFTLVGGLLRTNLAHIRKDRTVDPDLAAGVVGGRV